MLAGYKLIISATSQPACPQSRLSCVQIKCINEQAKLQLRPWPRQSKQILFCLQIYGPESSGKTTLALHAIAEVQKQGGTAVLIDAEHAFDVSYAKVSQSS